MYVINLSPQTPCPESTHDASLVGLCNICKRHPPFLGGVKSKSGPQGPTQNRETQTETKQGNGNTNLADGGCKYHTHTHTHNVYVQTHTNNETFGQTKGIVFLKGPQFGTICTSNLLHLLSLSLTLFLSISLTHTHQHTHTQPTNMAPFPP